MYFALGGLLHAVDAAEHDLEGVGFLRRERAGVADEHGGALEDRLDGAELVGLEGRAAGNEIADGVGEAEARGDLDGAAEVTTSALMLLFGEKAPGQLRIGSGDAQALRGRAGR